MVKCQRNDLEESAFRLCPTIKDVRAIKHQGCLMARMTGSGPHVCILWTQRMPFRRLIFIRESPDGGKGNAHA